MAIRSKVREVPETLPQLGMSRWEQLKHFIPISKESWRQLSMNGKAPAPVRLTERCTMYQNAEIHRWLADPVNYKPADVRGQA